MKGARRRNKLDTAELCKNRRTLKKRIRRVNFLCILITMLLFCGQTLVLGVDFFRVSTGLITNYFSSYIAQNMSSDSFLEEMGISTLHELDPKTPEFRKWIADMKKVSSLSTVKIARPMLSGVQEHIGEARKNGVGMKDPEMLFPGLMRDLSTGDLFKVRIVVNSREIYNEEGIHNENTVGYADRLANDNFSGLPVNRLLDFLCQKSETQLKDPAGTTIATVTVNVNRGYIMLVGVMFVLGILFAGLLAIIAGLLVSKILTIPLVVPLHKLDEKIREIAGDTGEAAMTKHIEIKKPLREIELLANSTNSIMEKMKGYNELLMAQNQELEAQNEELANSKRQIEEAQNLLVQTENMASIGQLTAAITHEINTPLGAISSNAQMIGMLLNMILESRMAGEDDELQKALAQLQEANNVSIMACNRVNQIIRSLKNFSKVDQAEFQEADINEGMKSVLVLTSNLWKRKIVIHEEYGPIPGIKCFPGMLNQVFMNLVVNSVQAIQEKGDIWIRTWNDDSNVYVSIRDNGCGIREEDIPRIFDSGFTTKGQSLGMGLGLSISRSIMDKHNGGITVSSKPGEGSEFIVRIPIHRDLT